MTQARSTARRDPRRDATKWYQTTGPVGSGRRGPGEADRPGPRRPRPRATQVRYENGSVTTELAFTVGALPLAPDSALQISICTVPPVRSPSVPVAERNPVLWV